MNEILYNIIINLGATVNDGILMDQRTMRPILYNDKSIRVSENGTKGIIDTSRELWIESLYTDINFAKDVSKFFDVNNYNMGCQTLKEELVKNKDNSYSLKYITMENGEKETNMTECYWNACLPYVEKIAGMSVKRLDFK